MRGDKVVSDGIEYEVVWTGSDDLIGDRPTKDVDGVWISPLRLYNKTGKFKGKYKAKPKLEIEETLDGE